MQFAHVIINKLNILYSHRASLAKILSVKLELFSYPSVKTCVLGAQKNCLNETVLLSTHNICFD